MFETLDAWLQYIASLNTAKIDLGLDRVRAVFDRLPSINCPVITVAGTNGKGSTVTLLSSLYQNAGYRTGAYFSPHLMVFNERACVNGQMLSDEQWMQAFMQIEQQRGEILLTYFEFVTLAAIILFAESELDVLIMEVGLGGRLDAVNVLDPSVAVITSIALDHQDWLGDTRDAIAKEKAGIFREHCPAVCGDLDPPTSLIEAAQSLSAPLYLQGQEFHYEMLGNDWTWYGVSHRVEHLPLPALPVQNASTALMVIELMQSRLPIPESEAVIRSVFSQISMPGRFERADLASISLPVILDVAHNPASLTLLMTQLKKTYPHHRCVAVFSVLPTKDIDGLLSNAINAPSDGAMVASTEVNDGHVDPTGDFNGIDEWYVAPMKDASSVPVSTICAKIKAHGGKSCYTFASIEAALTQAIENASTVSNTVLVVFGSFYTVNEAKLALKEFE